jgi:DNA-binding NtrC family response regulator
MEQDKNYKILVVDDDRSALKALADVIRKEGYIPVESGTGQDALRVISSKDENLDLVLTDLRLGEIDGMQVLEAVRRIHPEIPVIILTAFADMESAIEAISKGAYDYLSKPFKLEHLRVVVKRALEQRSLKQENVELRSVLEKQENRFEIIGRSPEMMEVFKLVARVAPLPTTVLLQGESGTGKEMVARLIHATSRRKGPLKAVNCGALTESLLESELFGYVKGAFTGAGSSKRGIFEAANQGTCFLDEISNTSSALQMKLLRVLEEREVLRVGSTEPIPVDVRIVAATNQKLWELIEKGDFREDLYYRLKVVTIDLPALRHRRGDIPLLLDHFVHIHAKAAGKTIAVHDSVYPLLASYQWPGNVRELENAVERGIALNSSGILTPQDFPIEIRKIFPESVRKIPSSGPYKSLNEYQADYVIEVLKASGQNVSRTAEILKIDRRTVYRILERHGIKRS